MLQNYFKIALRALYRQKLYSAINVFSLSIGIACCTLILLFVLHEWRSDSFHEHADEIYRVYRIEQRVNGSTKRSAGVSAPMGPSLVSDLPNVQLAVRMRGGQAQVQRENEVFTEEILFADAGFFDLFTFPLESEFSAAPLESPQSIVLSSDMSRKYFGGMDPVGQTLNIRLGDAFEAFTVAGVAAPLPTSSSITFDFVIPYTRWPGYLEQADNWLSFNTAVYVRIAGGADEESLQTQLDVLTKQYYGVMIEENQAEGWWVNGDGAFDLQLQPLRDVHFSDGFTNMVAATTNAGNLYLLMGIGLIVLLLACVNFMTLAAGRATGRAREVGVRKTLGAHRGQLARQFWGEALLLSTLALAFGVAFAYLALPLFNNLAGAELVLNALDPVFVLGLLALTALCSFAAGSYPALILSSFRPTEVLKGGLVHGQRHSFARALVVVQFAISIGLITCTLVMYDQLSYVQSKNMGFADEEVVAVELHANQTDEDQLLARFRQRIGSRKDVLDVSGSSYAFGDGWSRTVMYQNDRQFIVYMMRADSRFLETMGMHLAAGRDFSEAMSTDREQAVIINEALAKELGWEDPIGQLLPGYEQDRVTIIGVVEDYHFQSLRNEIEPALIHINPSLGQLNYALVRIRTGQIAPVMDGLQAAWAEIAPDQPFIYEFLDQRLDALYAAERRWSQIVQTAALFALLIACLGLFGLATLSVERRRKEVGVRRVLGASSSGLAMLLSKDFTRLVLIAFLLACPLAYFVMDYWLDGFAYHTSLGAGAFVLAGGLALTIALLTVSYHTIRAAMSNPVNSLRYE